MRIQKPVALIAVVVLAAVVASLLKSDLRTRRRNLDLDVAPAALPVQTGGDSLPVTLSAGTGVFRALAINFLWLRSSELKRQGRFFESSALARAITRLQPRLPGVWVYQSWDLAYNMSTLSPREESFGWVVEGIGLLNDEGIHYNPSSYQLYAQLAFLYLNRIGAHPESDTRHFYRTELARVFEPKDRTPEADRHARWRETLEHGVDPARLEELARREGIPRLDLRAHATHCLYWADVGLAVASRARTGAPRHARERLERYRFAALLSLLTEGRVVKNPLATRYAFLPELRLLRVVQPVLEKELEDADHKTNAEREQDARFLRRFRATLTAYLLLHNRRLEAEQWFERYRQDIEAFFREEEDLASLTVPRNVDELVLHAVHGWAAPAHAEGDDTERREVLDRLAGLLRASLLVRLAGEGEFADGLVDLARSVRERWIEREGSGTLRPLEEYHRALAGDFFRSLADNEDSRDLAKRLEASVPPALLPLRESPPPRTLDLDRRAPLPPGINVEMLNPLVDREVER